MFDWSRFFDDVRELGPPILESGVVPGPPAGPFERHRAYPLAVDRDGPRAAVLFAALDANPDLARGWWSVAVRFTREDGRWRDGDEEDGFTTQRPFERPAVPENSRHTWVDWHTNGGFGDYGTDEPRYRHMVFGIATAGTERLVVTDETGRERDLAITPWCGAYVATVEGAFSRLTGHGPDGRLLGSFVCLDGAHEPRG
ncbi:MAG: hypothetical protein HZB46_04240 [Solirubrobacterales bacterium]|nr:hypothetical protein [Solirubrobacterales bacterium]